MKTKDINTRTEVSFIYGKPEYVADKLKRALNTGWVIISFTTTFITEVKDGVSQNIPISCVYIKNEVLERY